MADKLNPRRLTRQQLATVFTTPEMIKAFEALFDVTGSSADDIDLLTVLTDLAQQTADSNAAVQNSQAGQIERIASALEVLALAPATVPAIQPDDPHDCPTCAATREALVALTRRVDDLESR